MLSRVIRAGSTLAVLGLMTVSASAQPGGGRGGPGGGRGMRAGGSASEVMALLAAPEVRKEVKLSDEAYGAVEKLQKENQEAMQAAMRSFGRDVPDADRDKMRAEMVKRNEKSQAILDEVLPPEGLDRLLGLYVQWRGDTAAAGELVSKKLGLTDADKEKIQAAAAKAREDFPRPEGARVQPGERPSEEAMAAMRARMEEMQKKSNEAVQAALTAEQKKALEELKGPKFDFPESVRNPGFGFGGFGGFGGPGGRRGGRPNSESGN